MAGSDDDPLYGDGTGDFELDIQPRRKNKKPAIEKSTVDLSGTGLPDPPSGNVSPDAEPAPGMDMLDFESVPPDALPALELESIPAPTRRRVAAADLAMGDGEAESADPVQAQRPTRPDEAQRATMPATFEILPPAHEGRLPTIEVAAVAEYGPAPGFFGAIPYALHVLSRRKALVAATAEARRHRKTAELGVEQALSRLGRVVVEKAESLGGAVEAVTEDLDGAKAAVQLVGAQQEAAARADVDTDERRRALKQELETLRRELDPFRDRETKLQTQLGVREQDLARAQAKLQRAKIEERNAQHDPSRPAEGAALAEADRERHDKEVAVGQHAVRELQEQLAVVKRGLAEKLGRAAQIEDDLRRLDGAVDQSRREMLTSETEASQSARRALALLARRAIAANIAGAADPELTDRARRADDDLMRRRRREQITRAAIDAYDKPSVYQGVGLLGGAALVVVVFLLFVIARAIF